MDSSLSDALQRSIGPGFRVERELGGGGMSRVFLATDLSLDRQVVIKVLSPELAEGVILDVESHSSFRDAPKSRPERSECPAVNERESEIRLRCRHSMRSE